MSEHTTVTATIGLRVNEPARLAFAVAVAEGRPVLSESFEITVDGSAVGDVVESVDHLGTRHHIVDAPTGQLSMTYRADVTAAAPQPAADTGDMLLYRRPSRYCESDRFGVIARHLFPQEGPDLLDAIAEWVHDYLRYIPGISGFEDSALDTFFAGQGVCRDYTHLTAALLRARGVPARVAAVYAPGLAPMDFHLVTEAALGGRWQVIDTTRKAPRAALVRIATGRDAADTAFLTVQSGNVTFGPVSVTAYHHGDLRVDDHRHPVYL